VLCSPRVLNSEKIKNNQSSSIIINHHQSRSIINPDQSSIQINLINPDQSAASGCRPCSL
jgi:nanoRNase/pAp phosphatase (c-di-AMP/oligoRNAs hydrolase)